MKKLKYIFIGLIAAGIASSCLVDDEVDPYTQNMDYIVGFDQANVSLSYFEDEGVVQKDYAVSLKGSPDGDDYNQPITISYSVDSENSTAQEGVEFDFVTTGGTLTMPANTDFVLFPIDINTGNFDPDSPTELVLNIESSTDGVVVAEAYSSITIQFIGCQADVTGTYDMEITYTNTSGETSYYETSDEVITMSDINEFFTTTTPPWDVGDLAPGYDGFYFNIVCGVVYVPEQALGGYYGNVVQGINGATEEAGYVNSDTGDIHIEYTVCYDGSCRTLIVDYIHQ